MGGNPFASLGLTVSPMYGDRVTARDAFFAWLFNRDFYIHTPGHPSHVNRADVEHYGLPKGCNEVRIRYKGRTEVLTARMVNTGEDHVWIPGCFSEDSLGDRPDWLDEYRLRRMGDFYAPMVYVEAKECLTWLKTRVMPQCSICQQPPTGTAVWVDTDDCVVYCKSCFDKCLASSCVYCSLFDVEE